MAQDTLLGFPAHTLPYRCGKFIALSTASGEQTKLLAFFSALGQVVPKSAVIMLLSRVQALALQG